MYQLHKLWELQQLEIGEGKLQQSLEKEQQQVEAKLLEDGREIGHVQRRLEIAQKNINKLRQLTKKREDQAEQLQAKKSELNRKLYSGEVANPKELQDIQEQLDIARQQLASEEDKIIALLERFETEDNNLTLLTGELEAKEERQKQERLPLVRAKEETEMKLASVRLQIEEITRSIEENSLEFYRLGKRGGNKTVISKVFGETCGACHMEQSMNLLLEAKKGKNLVKCENCGRILLVE